MKRLGTVNELYVAKGKKLVHFNLKKDKPTQDELLKLVLGPTGNDRGADAFERDDCDQNLCVWSTAIYLDSFPGRQRLVAGPMLAKPHIGGQLPDDFDSVLHIRVQHESRQVAVDERADD